MARILVIEDEPVIALVLQEVLQDEGHEVQLARDGPAGLAVLADGPAPHLVITDWILPDLGGRDLLAQVSLSSPGVPVMVITGAVMRSGSLPAEGSYRVLLTKPFSVGQVVAAVQGCLNESQPAGGSFGE